MFCNGIGYGCGIHACQSVQRWGCNVGVGVHHCTCAGTAVELTGTRRWEVRCRHAARFSLLGRSLTWEHWGEHWGLATICSSSTISSHLIPSPSDGCLFLAPFPSFLHRFSFPPSFPIFNATSLIELPLVCTVICTHSFFHLNTSLETLLSFTSSIEVLRNPKPKIEPLRHSFQTLDANNTPYSRFLSFTTIFIHTQHATVNLTTFLSKLNTVVLPALLEYYQGRATTIYTVSSKKKNDYHQATWRGMEKMLKSPTGRGLLARPRLRIILLIVLVIFSSYYFLCSGPVPHFSIVPYLAETPGSSSGSTSSPKSSKHEHEHEHDEDDGSLKDGKPANADVIINQDIANPSGHTGQEGISTTKTDNIVGEKEREMLESWKVDINDLRKWSDPDDHEDPNDVEPGYETDGKVREAGSISRLQHEKDLRKMWRYAYKTTAK